jgi:predicted transcriptional regulator
VNCGPAFQTAINDVEENAMPIELQSGVEKNSSYIVPCVFKAVQMIEALRESRSGLRVEEFLAMTGYSRSTIYRILRTLTACEYIVRDRGGSYRLNHAVVSPADAATKQQRDFNRPLSPGNAHPGFERWGVRFGADGRRLTLRRSAVQEPSSASVQTTVAASA